MCLYRMVTGTAGGLQKADIFFSWFSIFSSIPVVMANERRKVKSLSCVWLFATPWTAADQAPPSMGFSRQEYWSGVPSPSLRSLFNFGQLSCFFLHTWLVHGPSPRCMCNFFLRWIQPQRPMGAYPHLLCHEIHSLFDPQEAFLCLCRQRVFLDLRVGHFISLL